MKETKDKEIKQEELLHSHLREKMEHDREQLNEKTEEIKRQISERKNTYSFKRIFHAAFNLSADQAGYEEIEERIESGVALRGTNMCILILAIFIASVGLNMNSTAVIIGAMLVSPLMGAIMGIGFAIAIYDTNLLKRSATILMFEVVVALATSTAYFMLSPITAPGSELLARTSPTSWDVIIAICGGLAGMIGTTRKEKSNIIPGVAIATALMPPLCTAGYGLSIGNLRYFAGAMYLFCINGVFIAISTMLITVFLGLPSKRAANSETKKHIFKRVAVVAIVAIVPSVFFAADIVKDSVFQTNVSSYIENELQFEHTQVVKYDVDEKDNELRVALIGAVLSEDEIENLERSMKNYHIESLSLNVQQTEVKAGITPEELEAYVKNETSQLSATNESDYQELQSQLIAAKSELSEYQSREVDVDDLQDEIKVLHPEVTGIRVGYLKNDQTEQMTIVVEVKEPLTKEGMQILEKWIEKRLEIEQPIIYQSIDDILYPVGAEQKKEEVEQQEESTEERGQDTEQGTAKTE